MLNRYGNNKVVKINSNTFYICFFRILILPQNKFLGICVVLAQSNTKTC